MNVITTIIYYVNGANKQTWCKTENLTHNLLNKHGVYTYIYIYKTSDDQMGRISQQSCEKIILFKNYNSLFSILHVLHYFILKLCTKY